MPRTQAEPLSLTSKGELLPWKGYWWKVEDVAVFEDGCEILLKQKAETFGNIKRRDAHRKWKNRHPDVFAKAIEIIAGHAGEEILDPDNGAAHVDHTQPQAPSGGSELSGVVDSAAGLDGNVGTLYSDDRAVVGEGMDGEKL